MAELLASDVATTAAMTLAVLALYLVRAWGVAPFATVLALDAGVGAPGVLALRLLSDLLLAAVLFWAVARWARSRDHRPAGRLGTALARLRAGLGRGSLVGNTFVIGYFLNSYLVFGLVSTLAAGRRRALAAAVAGDLAGFALDLLAVLGLSALVGGSRPALLAGMTVVALGLAGVNYLLQARLRPAEDPFPAAGQGAG